MFFCQPAGFAAADWLAATLARTVITGAVPESYLLARNSLIGGIPQRRAAKGMSLNIYPEILHSTSHPASSFSIVVA